MCSLNEEREKKKEEYIRSSLKLQGEVKSHPQILHKRSWKVIYAWRSGAETCMSALLVSHPCTSPPRVVSLSSRIVSYCYGSSVGTLCISAGVCAQRDSQIQLSSPLPWHVLNKLDLRYWDTTCCIFKHSPNHLSHCNSWTMRMKLVFTLCVCVCVCVCVLWVWVWVYWGTVSVQTFHSLKLFMQVLAAHKSQLPTSNYYNIPASRVVVLVTGL